MPLIYSHDNKTEITGLTKDGAWYSVNLGPFVQNQNCIGVLLQFVNTNTYDFRDAGISTPFGGPTGAEFRLFEGKNQIMMCTTWVYGNPYIGIKCEDSYVDVYIVAEFLKDGGAVLRVVGEWYTQPNIPVGWITVTVQPLGDDTYDDIEAALVYGAKSGGSQAFCARPLGSTVEVKSLNQFQVFAMPVQTNVNGQYQIYIPTAGCGPPTVAAIEIGYIKKGYGFKAIFDPEVITLPANTDWEELSLRGTIDSYSTHAVMRLIGASTGGVRAKGSTNSPDNLGNTMWQTPWTAVDEVRALEYQSQGNPLNFSVWGYIEDPPSDYPLTVENDQVTLAPGTINIE